MAPCKYVGRYHHCSANVPLNFLVFGQLASAYAATNPLRTQSGICIYQLVALQQEADRVRPVTANLRLVCAVGHGHGHRFHFNGAGLGRKPACAAVFLDDPEIEAAGCSLFDEARSYFPKESSADSPPHILRGHVEIIEERAERRITVWVGGRQVNQLSKDGEKRLAVYVRKTRQLITTCASQWT